MMTVGHSNRPLDTFIELLRAHGVATLADVHTVPRSRSNPQFNRETLPQALAAAGIRYLHLPELGGLRHPRKDSTNTGWRNLSFRGNADYMQTPEFGVALAGLEQLDRSGLVAIMCAEAVPWRCHRSLIADALAARGVAVRHILSLTKSGPHAMRPFARVEGGSVTYPEAG
jgi:uncharacterized protein (DUF488 family)